jgi:hypothetical protein
MPTTRNPSRTPSQSRKSRASGSRNSRGRHSRGRHSRGRHSRGRHSRKSSKDTHTDDREASTKCVERTPNSVQTFYNQNQASMNTAAAIAALATVFVGGYTWGHSRGQTKVTRLAHNRGYNRGAEDGILAYSQEVHNRSSRSGNPPVTNYHISPELDNPFSNLLRTNYALLPEFWGYKPGTNSL